MRRSYWANGVAWFCVVILGICAYSCAMAAEFAPVASTPVEDFGVEKAIPCPGCTLLLVHGQFNCPDGQKRAVLLAEATGQVFLGCWAVNEKTVDILYEDGDSGHIDRKFVLGDKKDV